MSGTWRMLFHIIRHRGIFKCFQLHKNYLRRKLGSLHSAFAFVRIKVMLDVDEWFHLFGGEEMSGTSKRAVRGPSGLNE